MYAAPYSMCGIYSVPYLDLKNDLELARKRHVLKIIEKSMNNEMLTTDEFQIIESEISKIMYLELEQKDKKNV